MIVSPVRPMSPSRPRPPSLLAAFVVWTAIALFSVVQAAAIRASSHQPTLPFSTVLVIAGNCWLWALYTPLIWRISERYPIEGSWHGAAVVHVGVLLGMLALDSVFNALLLIPALKLPARSILKSASDLLFVDALCYVVVVAIEHGRRYYGRSVRLESDLRQARLQALEAQLRPHFLFNALNTVSSLIRAREDQAAIKAVAALGDVLRGALRQTEPEVALRDELGLAERYLDLERARFGDSLQFSVEAEPETAGAQVPSLLLQPLVENALKHGRARDGSAHVHIQARREGRDLRIEVRDSGTGPANGAHEGIGLSNTRARLQELYGDRGRLTLTTANGGGAVAVVQLPLREAPIA
jgi:two-component system, LytTR family, sensor kinase